MDNVLYYKDYAGSICHDKSGCLHGKILHVDDVITYEAEDRKA